MGCECESEIFSLSGASFLTAVDWNNSHHRRSVAACLVQGVYTLEEDRQKNRQGDKALGPPWWHSFNFRVVQVLVDNHDVSHFGAVFEYQQQQVQVQVQGPPRYVIAFRGTIPKHGNRAEDFKLDLHLLINDLHKSSRFQIALDTARQIVLHVGPANVWLAGHSLGSSLALVVGREMAKSAGLHLETYLFNPPFISAPIDRLPNEKLKLGLRFANSLVTAGLAAAHGYARDPDPFALLASWVPYLFINRADPICSEYAAYFKHREDMEAMGAGRIGKLATKHSVGSLLSSALGKDTEAVHLLPSAYLTLNVTPPNTLREAHTICQWWRQDLQLDYKYYQHN